MVTLTTAGVTTKPHLIGGVRAQHFLELYTPEDPENYEKYKRLLAEKQKEKDPETGRFRRPWSFEIMKGYFKQADDDTNPYNFDFIANDFGVKKPWKQVIKEVRELNGNSNENDSYKVLFLARHGQGWHNFAIAKYGQTAWDEYWSHLNGDDEITWGPDPFLTPLGVEQAKDNCKAWKKQIGKDAPVPSAFYSSPFTRSIQTLINTWEEIADYEFLIKEDLRETIGVHTCDKRSTKSIIEERFKIYDFLIEDGFTEQDELYTDDYREPIYEQSLRINNFLNFLFELDFEKEKKDHFISITSHSGTIRSFIMATGHKEFAVGTGGMVPIIVKATRRTDDL